MATRSAHSTGTHAVAMLLRDWKEGRGRVSSSLYPFCIATRSKPMEASKPTRVAGVADGAGVFGAVFAALCCAGTPVVVSVVSALGLSFLRSDRILWPLMLVSLVVALWGFWKGQQMHRSTGPLILGLCGAAALTTGVIFVHGFPARELIGAGAVSLVCATIWNIVARRSCGAPRVAAP